MGEILCPGCGVGTWSDVERDQHRAMGCYALADRQQRAREAYYDRYALGDNIGGGARKAALREAIETATRVRITPEVRAAALAADNIDDGLIAAFRAAGFEVEE